MKTITVTFPHHPIDGPPKMYKITKVEQSVEFDPGQYLTKDQIKDLCDIPKQWKVVIMPNKG